jgi:hypothetical protein
MIVTTKKKNKIDNDVSLSYVNMYYSKMSHDLDISISKQQTEKTFFLFKGEKVFSFEKKTARNCH